ncbi:VOC family protein [Pontibacter pamirensis]|uniref:VOC family protein n=1 Tax=Pontibacter pamirensis TaxID=2562824 RepID=UPI00138A19D5|nr:VOC family protein [Pontibacter pamirensis]
MKNAFRLLLLAIFSLSLHTLKAQSKDTGGVPTVALNHIAMYVHDLEKSTAFYENVLQLKQIPEPFKDGLHTWFTLGPAGQLHLIQGAEQHIKRNKNDHMCFSVLSIEDFISNLNKHKVEYTNWPGTAKAPTVRVDGVKQVYFQDPDGHWIEVNDDASLR